MVNIVKLYNDGLSTREIGKISGVNHVTIMDRLKKQGIVLRKKTCGLHTDEVIKKISKSLRGWSNKGYIDPTHGYKIISVNGKHIKEHRYVWMKKNQIPIPKSCVIHHINECKTDNNIENLVMLPRDLHNKLHKGC